MSGSYTRAIYDFRIISTRMYITISPLNIRHPDVDISIDGAVFIHQTMREQPFTDLFEIENTGRCTVIAAF